MSRSVRHPSRSPVRTMKRAAGLSLGVSLLFGGAGSALAQQNDGPIVIPGNAETNPAAAAEMAAKLKPVTVAATPAAPAAPAMSSADIARASGYRAATQAADAAMRNAALALEARAEAADDSMDEASNGMIVVPGPGQNPKPAASAGMMKASYSPAQSALPSVKSTDARDVIPVIVQRDNAPSTAAKPVAAQAAMPVAAARRVAPPAPLQPGAPTQDGESIRAAALAFLQQQAAGLPGKVEITVLPVFPRGLAPCSSLDPFMPTGSRVWGRMTVGVRCVGERPWTLYVQARVAVNATYYLAARAIAPGEVLTEADLVAREGDLTAMPQAVITDPAQAVGATALGRVGANLPLRTDLLRAATSVSVGQSVHVVADGAGFAISAEGSVMNNASPGQQVHVKTAGGQIITGIVKDNQTVEIRM